MDLTFNYTLGPDDLIYDGFIVLQAKKTGTSDYENVATFSPPGSGNNFFTTTDFAMIVKDRSELINVTALGLDTFCVVMRVLDVRCSDEKEYRFSVSFFEFKYWSSDENCFYQFIRKRYDKNMMMIHFNEM